MRSVHCALLATCRPVPGLAHLCNSFSHVTWFVVLSGYCSGSSLNSMRLKNPVKGYCLCDDPCCAAGCGGSVLTLMGGAGAAAAESPPLPAAPSAAPWAAVLASPGVLDPPAAAAAVAALLPVPAAALLPAPDVPACAEEGLGAVGGSGFSSLPHTASVHCGGSLLLALLPSLLLAAPCCCALPAEAPCWCLCVLKMYTRRRLCTGHSNGLTAACSSRRCLFIKSSR